MLTIGKTVVIYCTGSLVGGTIDRAENGGYIVTHKPIKWGDDFFTETFISKNQGKKHFTPKTFIQL